MRNGAGVAATLYVDGQLVNFSLALVIDKKWGFSHVSHKLIFIID